MNKSFISYILFLCGMYISCNPVEQDDIKLGPLPAPPDFSFKYVEGDSNRIVVTDLSANSFIRLWSSTGAVPANSTKVSDTLYFAKAGTYAISLYISEKGGNGTSSSSKNVTISQDAETPCTGPVSLLTGECSNTGKCWKFSTVAGAITVGSGYGAGDWYTSPAAGLVASQYDDRWCFLFDGTKFDYRNQGKTVNPWAGYADVNFTPVAGPWTYSIGTGQNGADQILLNPGQFIGTMDSYHVLDVVKLTKDELIVRTPIRDQSSNVVAGWFEFHLVAE